MFMKLYSWYFVLLFTVCFPFVYLQNSLRKHLVLHAERRIKPTPSPQDRSPPKVQLCVFYWKKFHRLTSLRFLCKIIFCTIRCKKWKKTLKLSLWNSSTLQKYERKQRNLNAPNNQTVKFSVKLWILANILQKLFIFSFCECCVPRCTV